MVDNKKCTGCSACASICPRNCIGMKTDNKGFLYPCIDLMKCINCGKCQKVCPVEMTIDQGDDKRFIQTFAMINTNPVLRSNSSSGGVFPTLMRYIISKDGIVCGAMYNGQFEVYHAISDNVADLPKYQGAKYVQSNIGSVYSEIKQALEEGRKVLFVGTPCQVAGLISYLGKPNDNLITVDMVCHGVAAPVVWKTYLQERIREDARNSNIISVNLRDKSSGWSRYSYSVSIEYSNGKQYKRIQSDDPFSKGFTNNLFLRHSCEVCAFKGTNRLSDITLGDYWGVWNYNPELDDNKGTSLVMVHSEKGMKLIETIKENFQMETIDLEIATEENKSVYESADFNDNALAFWEHYFRTGKVCDFLYELYPSTKISFREKMGILRRRLLKQFLKNEMDKR